MAILKFNEYNSTIESNLLVVDVQKSFTRFFNEIYLGKLNTYCKKFSNVYQIWDNHVHGTNVDKDYLYHKTPEIPINDELYKFPNQVKLVEKRYNYDVDVDFYRKILSDGTFKMLKEKEQKNTLKKGDIFLTDHGTCIVYIANNHKWFHIGKKLLDLLNSLKGKTVTIVGGSDNECLDDIFTAAESLGVDIRRNSQYIYSATHCPS